MLIFYMALFFGSLEALQVADSVVASSGLSAFKPCPS